MSENVGLTPRWRKRRLFPHVFNQCFRLNDPTSTTCLLCPFFNFKKLLQGFLHQQQASLKGILGHQEEVEDVPGLCCLITSSKEGNQQTLTIRACDAGGLVHGGHWFGISTTSVCISVALHICTNPNVLSNIFT